MRSSLLKRSGMDHTVVELQTAFMCVGIMYVCESVADTSVVDGMNSYK